MIRFLEDVFVALVPVVGVVGVLVLCAVGTGLGQGSSEAE